MKTRITLLISAWMFFAFNPVSAQHFIPGAYDYHELALLFSQYSYKGSSRIQGLGGTQISLGGDLSSALSNPAGLGFYNRSEFSFTPSVNVYSTDAQYLGQLTETVNPRFNFDQFGVALHKKYRNKDSGFIGGTFGISYSKVNEFHYDFDVAGLNDTNDILDYFTQNANHNNWNVLTDMADAYDNGTYLITVFEDENTNQLFYDRTVPEYPSPEYPVDQLDRVETYGSQNVWNFSYGVNYKDRLYFGASVGLTSINYTIDKHYSEIYPDGTLVDLNIYERLTVDGTGANATFGIIGRPIDALTVGASIISPSFISLSEEALYDMEANFANVDALDRDGNPVTLNNEFTSRDYIFEYNLNTPARFNGGLTYFISKYGFISADVEWVNYSKMRLSSDSDSMNDQDDIIRDVYQDVLNLKVGAEGRLDKFRIRAGYSFNPSPYADKANQRDLNKFAFGVGYRNSKMFVDIATTYLTGKASYSPYSFAPVTDDDLPDVEDIYVTPMSTLDYSDLNFNFTLGFFFQ